MPQTLQALKVFNIFIASVALSAMLHGLLSGLDRGGFILPCLAVFFVLSSIFFLDASLSGYGWLGAIAVTLGVILWRI